MYNLLIAFRSLSDRNSQYFCMKGLTFSPSDLTERTKLETICSRGSAAFMEEGKRRRRKLNIRFIIRFFNAFLDQRILKIPFYDFLQLIEISKTAYRKGFEKSFSVFQHLIKPVRLGLYFFNLRF